MMMMIIPGRGGGGSTIAAMVVMMVSAGNTSVVQGFSSLTTATTRASRPTGGVAASGYCFRGCSSSALFSEPSDTSIDTDENWEFEEEQSSATTTTATTSTSSSTTSSLLDLLPPVSSVTEVSLETRAAINEAILQLEKLNPTAVDPTVSPLLNGVWDLKYAGGYAPSASETGSLPFLTSFLFGSSTTNGKGGGYSPALFVLSSLQKMVRPAAGGKSLIEWKQVEIAISRSQPRVEASVQFSIPLLLGGGGGGSAGPLFEGTAKIISRLETMSGLRMKETYESAVFIPNSDNNSIGAVTTTTSGNTFELPPFLQYSRDLYVTYLDDDVLIFRDATGVPELLLRQEKQFSPKSWRGTDPE